ncbi:Hydrolase-4 domain-containing protein [Mycena venus]|uniref:Hydrolase-4 domain-containing protein n=1 Tax=Mycena venus TaxID=2733690 RepID=A0A8H7CLQ3_9AGAR|nr:Hydrolase-4 domain-containing protein [Mycena venus]
MASNVSRYVGYALLVPCLLAATYVLASLPIVSKQIPGPVEPGLGSLPMNSRARAVYSEDFVEGGAYVQLPLGRVRYWLIGPRSGKKVVLIHGITIPAIAFARIGPLLAAAGYRVLLYDLYGRGYSDAPQGVSYDPQLYVTQLALLLQHLHWTSVRVVGFSMGGAIAASFVAAFPALVEREVVLIASAGAAGPAVPLSKFRHWSFVERRVKRRLLASRAARPNSSETPLEEIVRLQAEHLRGYTRAIISSLHDGLITKLHWAFTSSSWRGRRVLLINGDRDIIVPPNSAQVLHSMLASAALPISDSMSDKGMDVLERPPPDILLVPVPGAGHDLTWTHSEEVAKAVLEFLDTGPTPVAVGRGPRRYQSRATYEAEKVEGGGGSAVGAEGEETTEP